MESSHPHENEISELVILAMDNRIAPQQAQRLQYLLKTSEHARSVYFEYISIQTGLKKVSASIAQSTNDEVLDHDLWNELAKTEQTAAAIEIVKEEIKHPAAAQPPSIQQTRKINKLYLGFLLTSMAALLAMIAYLKVDQYLSSQPIAMLTETQQARWATAKGEMEPGHYLERDFEYYLQSGLAKVRFEYGAELILEGPVIFSCNSKEQLYLRQGKAYAIVPSLATGFTIETPSSRVIDLGTEFGVEVEPNGSSNVQVFKGHTSLISGRRGRILKSFMMGEQEAKHVDSITGHVKNIAFNRQAFVRRADSATDFVWNGRPISLADVVGGGNGFGTGTFGHGINPANGKSVTDVMNKLDEKNHKPFSPVPQNPFVDCVFLPGKNENKSRITTAGHILDSAYNIGKSGLNINIINAGYEPGEYLQNKWHKINVKINNVPYAIPERPVFYVHANAGITFDLNAIRKSIPGLEISELKALIAPPDKNRREVHMNIYVLLDNLPVLIKENYSEEDHPISLSQPVPQNSQFLTFMVTKGTDYGTWDWCLFAESQLVLNPDE